jgi:transposase
MPKVQKTYTPEFKREAVRLAWARGKSIAQVARELGISDTTIHQWRKELTDTVPKPSPKVGHQTTEARGPEISVHGPTPNGLQTRRTFGRQRAGCTSQA